LQTTSSEPLWNRQLLDHFRSTAAENRRGVEHRGGFYETARPALTSQVPNHLFQLLLTMTAMEPPNFPSTPDQVSQLNKPKSARHPADFNPEGCPEKTGPAASTVP